MLAQGHEAGEGVTWQMPPETRFQLKVAQANVLPFISYPKLNGINHPEVRLELRDHRVLNIEW